MSITTGIITLLNVGDADAMIVSLDKGNQNLIMVVDGGKPSDYALKVKPALMALLNEKGKEGPDIVVATHYDSDHIGGLIPLVDDYIDHIKEVWVHSSAELLEQWQSLTKAQSREGKVMSWIEFNFTNRLANAPAIIKEAVETQQNFVFESLKQLNTFLRMIPPEKAKHVYHGYRPDGWEEVLVLGPTENFYKSLFPDGKTLESLILEEAEGYVKVETPEFLGRFFELVHYPKSDCERLKKENQTRLTPTNKASIIIAIDTDKGRSLLTGDAGIASFKAIPDWEKELKDLSWLKVPHHGSDNNISREVLQVMSPLSADCSGNRHQDEHVLNCIRSNPRTTGAVRSTKDGQDLTVHI